MCECGMFKDERGDHTLACQESQWRTRIHDRWCETAHEEQANVRRMLRGNEHEGDGEGRWWTSAIVAW